MSNLPSPPSSPGLGESYFDTTLDQWGLWNGVAWNYTGSNSPSNPGGALKRLTNTESGMQTVEYGNVASANGIQTIFSSNTGTSGVVEKIRLTGGGEGMINNWIQISYDGGVTFPFIAELGTLFCAYSGSGAGSNTPGKGPWEVNCAHLSTQQASTYGTNFYATHILTYPIPFTNGLLIQIFNPTSNANSECPYAEVTVAYCSASQVPPYQLQCTGTYGLPGPNGNVAAVTISAMTNVTSTVTATIPTTSFLTVGQNIQLNYVTGYTNVSGTQTVTSILNGTQFQFTNMVSGSPVTPSGSYTANSGSLYNWSTQQGTNGLTLGYPTTASNVPMYGNIYGQVPALTYQQIGQLASITGTGGWAVGLAYSAKGASGLTYLERNFGWYVDGATPPTPSGTTATPTAASFTITACTNSGTTVTATVSSSSGIGVGQNVILSGVTGLTNVNGSWTVTAVNTGSHTFSFVVTTTPTGSYTANSGTVYTSGSPYGTQVGSPTMMTTGTEDTFDSAYYDWALTYPSGVNTPGSGVLSSVAASPVSGTAYTNPCGVPFDIYMQAGGSVSSVVLNAVTLPMTLTSGQHTLVRIPPLGSITLTFTGTAPSWQWVVSDYAPGGPLDGYSSPTAMGLGNGSTNHGGYYNAFLDILQSCGGYRFNTSLQLWLLTESHVTSTDSHNLSWCLLYYKDLT